MVYIKLLLKESEIPLKNGDVFRLDFSDVYEGVFLGQCDERPTRSWSLLTGVEDSVGLSGFQHPI